MAKKIQQTVQDNTCLALYIFSPAITAEGDEERKVTLGYINKAFENGMATFVGWTYADKPERLPAIDNNTATQVQFKVQLLGLTPFNDENDFTPVITAALRSSNGLVTNAEFYEASVSLKRLDISITNKI